MNHLNHVGEVNYAKIVGYGGSVRYNKYVILRNAKEIRTGLPPDMVRWAESKGLVLTEHWTSSHREKGWMASLYVSVERIGEDEYLRHKKFSNTDVVNKLKLETEVW